MCKSCKESTHPTAYCPFLHLTLSNQRILQKYNYFRPQERLHFLRKPKRNYGARFKYCENKVAAKLVFVDANSSESHTLLSSNKIDSSSMNLEVNQMSSKNSIFISGSPRKSLEKNFKSLEKNLANDQVLISSEDIKDDNHKAKKKKKTRSLSCLIKERAYNSQSEINSEDGSSCLPHIKKGSNRVNHENSSGHLRSVKEKKDEKSDDSSDSCSSVSSKSADKNKSNVENANNTTTLNNFQTDMEKNNLYDDVVKEYIYYFPHNNVEDVTEKVNVLILNNIKKKKLSRFRSIRKSWVEISPNKTLKSEDYTNSYKKKRSTRSRGTLGGEFNFFEKNTIRRRSSMSRMKVINILRENKIWNKKTGFFEKIKNFFIK